MGARSRRAPPSAPAPRRLHPAVWAFGLVEAGALVLWLAVSRSDWFYIDEWDFIAGRKAGDLGDLFRAHNGHWTTLPVLTFRLLYTVFGLRTYVPYRVVIIVLYLTAAALLFAVMLRAAVHPWIAFAAGSLFALFGAGWENILLPFQIAFTGSLVFGLTHLLLADHDGPFDRRDGLGLGAGLLALMCSGVGIVMVAVVGGATLARRGLRVAALHVVPPAVCYVAWLIAIGHRDHAVGHFTAGDVAAFTWAGLRAAFGAIGPVGAFGVVVAVVLVTGLVLAAQQRQRTARLRELAAPGALLVGSIALLAITAVNRAGFGADWARQSRYVSLVAAMTLPALAIAADAIATRWRRCLPIAIALFLVGIPANLHAANRAQRFLEARDAATRATMLNLAFDRHAGEVPRFVHPEPTTAGAVTIGWLLDAAAHDRLPHPRAADARLRASTAFRLSFVQHDRATITASCRTLRRPAVLDLRAGQRIGILDGGVFLEPAARSLVGPPMLFVAAPGKPIFVLRDVRAVRIRAVAGGAPRICIDRR